VTRALTALALSLSIKCGIAGISQTDFSPDRCEPNFTDRVGLANSYKAETANEGKEP
jgi:hypothetical protein